MAFVLKNIPQKRQNLKHAISLFTGLFMLRFVYGIDCLHGVMSATVTYLICLTVPRKHVHIYVFIWAMGYMTSSHLYRMTYFYMVDQFDFTRTQMVLTMKLTSFAFSLYDGSCDMANNSKSNSGDSISNSKSNNDNDNIDDNNNNNSNNDGISNSNNTSNSGKSDDTDLLVNESVTDAAIQSPSLRPINLSINPGINKTENEQLNYENRNDKIDTSNSKNEDENENKTGNENQDTLSRKARLSHRISESRTKYALTLLPTPLEFGGYVFCFPNLLAGPAFVYVDYIQGMNYRWREVRKEEGKVMEGEEREEEREEKGVKSEHEVEKKVIVKDEKEDEKMINSNSYSSSNSTTTPTTTSHNNDNNNIVNNNTMTNTKKNYSKKNNNSWNNKDGHVAVSSTVAALHRLSVGLLCLILYFIISSKTPISRQYDIQWQTTHHFLYRMGFISISFLGERFKFYFAWKVSEGACVMAGFGLQEENVIESRDKSRSENRNENRNIIEKKNDDKNGSKNGSNDDEKDKQLSSNNAANESDDMICCKIVSNKMNNSNDNNSNSNSILDTLYNIIGLQTHTPQTHKQSHTQSQYVWRGVENVDIIAYEFSTNIQSLSRAWNKRTQSWLEQYVYNRTEQSLLTTYTVSALWHGLYPGYFMFFFSAALMSSTERLVRKKINPLILTPTSSPLYSTRYCVIIRGVYTVLCWFLTSVTLTYHAQTFYMKSFSRSVQAFESFYYLPNIAFFLFYCVLYFAPTPTPSPTLISTKALNGEFKEINNNKNEIENENENENVGVIVTKIKSL
jgi:MBOAT, membrane-bound O-acyltransferase family